MLEQQCTRNLTAVRIFEGLFIVTEKSIVNFEVIGKYTERDVVKGIIEVLKNSHS